MDNRRPHPTPGLTDELRCGIPLDDLRDSNDALEEHARNRAAGLLKMAMDYESECNRNCNDQVFVPWDDRPGGKHVPLKDHDPARYELLLNRWKDAKTHLAWAMNHVRAIEELAPDVTP